MVQSLPSEAEELVDRLPTDQEPTEVVRTKKFVLEPMTLEDALEQVAPHCPRVCTQDAICLGLPAVCLTHVMHACVMYTMHCQGVI